MYVFGLYQSCGNKGVFDVYLYLGCGGGWCYVYVSLYSLRRWQVQVSVYCAS